MCISHSPVFQTPSAIGVEAASPRDWRRRSADVGGLHLATTTDNQGGGWMGGEDKSIDTSFAEYVGELYTQTSSSVHDNSLTVPPSELTSSVRSRLIHSLDRWSFAPHELPDEEALECTLLLFEALFRVEGMQEAIPVTMKQISSFIHHLKRIYRYENSYHNFEHALDVLQATQSYLKSAGMVPSPRILLEPENVKWRSRKSFNSNPMVSCLGPSELFILYIAAIGHDVGHPGFSNGFMKNAKTPLSVVFGNESALENLHFLFLLKIMKQHRLTALLDERPYLRKLLQQSILATDMGVHRDFMERMQLSVEGELGTLCQRQINICQAILKNADISNPTRPFLVSKHWAKALMQEWTAQAQLEEELQLPPTVIASDDPMQEAKGQIFFISFFAKPLLLLTEKAVPEMGMYVTQCKINLGSWQKIKANLEKQDPRTPSSPLPFSTPSSHSPAPPGSPRQTSSYLNVLPMSLPQSISVTESVYAPSTSGRSETEYAPGSPTESESSAVYSSVSENSTTSHRALSTIAGSVSSSGPVQTAPMPHAAIRSASKVGSLRKAKEARRKQSRNSWCVTAPSAGGAGGLQSPTPPLGTAAPLDGPDGDTPKKSPVTGMSVSTGNFIVPRPLNVSLRP